MIYTDPTPIKKNEEMFQNCCLSAKRTQAADVHVYNLNQWDTAAPVNMWRLQSLTQVDININRWSITKKEYALHNTVTFFHLLFASWGKCVKKSQFLGETPQLQRSIAITINHRCLTWFSIVTHLGC